MKGPIEKLPVSCLRGCRSVSIAGVAAKKAESVDPAEPDCHG